VLGVIPARLGSTRFPRKVLARIGDKLLVQHVHERLSRATEVDEVLVATDSPDVEDAVRAFGGTVVRVNEPCATGSDRAAVAAQGRDAGIVVSLQADQPCIAPADIDAAVRALAPDGGHDIATLAFESTDPAGYASRDVVKVVTDREGRALYFSRAGIPADREPSEKPLYLHHVGIYCFRRAALERFAALPRTQLEVRESLEQLRALEHGMTIKVVRSTRESVSVDREADVAAAERALGREADARGPGLGRPGERGMP